ncbi:MAG: 2-hydroxyacid dehydrogenase [Chryseolinea sp.]
MKVAFYSVHKFEREQLLLINNNKHDFLMLEVALSDATVGLALGCTCICIFVSDKASAVVLKECFSIGIRFIVLRSAGFNHVDVVAAHNLQIKLARVPEYSPYSVAEHSVTLMLALNRQLVHAHNRINELNFSLDGLTGFDMHGKTAGIIGTGKIGRQVARILRGFGCHILAFDVKEDESLVTETNVTYTDLRSLMSRSDIISLHLPLNAETKHIVSRESISWMKKGVMLINTSRGGLINTTDTVGALKSGHIGYFGIDVYEEEDGLFFQDHSQDILQDDVIARLMTFRNVLITSHQAFLTDTALHNIANTTIHNIDCFEQGITSGNELTV